MSAQFHENVFVVPLFGRQRYVVVLLGIACRSKAMQ
jgi:hypothetical protein